jgi:hypothetical protein
LGPIFAISIDALIDLGTPKSILGPIAKEPVWDEIFAIAYVESALKTLYRGAFRQAFDQVAV